MTKTRIIGDVHGKYDLYANIIKSSPYPTIQVGDMGVGFSTIEDSNKLRPILDGQQTHRFIRGNHDDPEAVKTIDGWISDGFVENDVMFIGGAWSIDYQLRTEGVSWWAEEQLSLEELGRCIDAYSMARPRVMITHDCPESISWDMIISKGLAFGYNRIPTRTSQAFQTMFELHQPEHWFFGHWHCTLSETHNGTKFQCINELDFVDMVL